MSGYEYTITHTVDAPVDLVWRMWTEQDHYEKWTHAVPGSVSMDARPGGQWQATMTSPDGQEFPITGSYPEVVPGKRLVVAMDIPGSEPTLMRIDLTSAGEQTEVVVSQTCATEQDRDNSKQGTEMLLQWCDEYLATLR